MLFIYHLKQINQAKAMLTKNYKEIILFFIILVASSQEIPVYGANSIVEEIFSLKQRNPTIKQWYAIEDSFFRTILTYTDNINIAHIKKGFLSYVFFVLYPMLPLLCSENGSLLHIPSHETPRLNAVLDDLCAKLDIKRPEIYLLANQTCYNFFTTSFTSNNAAIILSNTLLEILSDDELTVALAHELSHIKTYDALKKTAISAAQISLIGITLLWFIMSENIGLKPSHQKYFIFFTFFFIVTIGADLFFTQYSENQADKTAIDITQKDESYAGMVTKIEKYQTQKQLNDYYYLQLRLNEFSKQHPIYAKLLQTVSYIYHQIKLFSLNTTSAYKDQLSDNITTNPITT